MGALVTKHHAIVNEFRWGDIRPWADAPPVAARRGWSK
jgi:hypothetical protein